MINFPDPSQANADGLLAVGGDLESETLLAAYSKGIFPWYSQGQPPLWWSPDPRMVLFPDEFYCNRRLARRLKQQQYRFSWDEAFEKVVQACAEIPRKGESGTWILPEMMQAYQKLHLLGHAHSVEVWEGDDLVGGLYGVLLKEVLINSMNSNHESRITNPCVENLTSSGAIACDSRLEVGDSESHEFPSRINKHLLNGIFFAESMFGRRTDASKMALAKLVARAESEAWKVIDCQFHTAHLESLGAREISRAMFLSTINPDDS